MLQKYLFLKILIFIIVVTTEGGRTSHYSPRFLFQSHICIHSFIWGMVFENSCASHEAEGLRGERVRHRVCHLVTAAFVLISPSLPLSYCLCMLQPTLLQPFLGTLTSGKTIFMLISLQYAFLGQTGTYCWLQLLSGFIMKSRILFWARRIIDWEGFQRIWSFHFLFKQHMSLKATQQIFGLYDYCFGICYEHF